jgi:hypothetical protein
MAIVASKCGSSFNSPSYYSTYGTYRPTYWTYAGRGDGTPHLSVVLIFPSLLSLRFLRLLLSSRRTLLSDWRRIADFVSHFENALFAF